jgi:NAD(P)H-dependent flavin oxidoreductase YrpB (nitropropane dioxygenase family)
MKQQLTACKTVITRFFTGKTVKKLNNLMMLQYYLPAENKLPNTQTNTDTATVQFKQQPTGRDIALMQEEYRYFRYKIVVGRRVTKAL